MYSNSLWSSIGRAAIVTLVIFSFPLQSHPCRTSLDHIISWRPETSTRTWEQPGQERYVNSFILTAVLTICNSNLKYALMTAAILILSYITAMTVSNIERVFAFVGSTGSTAISFIIPGLFYWKISEPVNPWEGIDEEREAIIENNFKSNNENGKWLRIVSLALAIYGVAVMTLCLTVNIINVEHNHN